MSIFFSQTKQFVVSVSEKKLEMYDPSWRTLVNGTLPEGLKARKACSMKLREFSVSATEARYVQFVAESFYGALASLQYIGFE